MFSPKKKKKKQSFKDQFEEEKFGALLDLTQETYHMQKSSQKN